MAESISTWCLNTEASASRGVNLRRDSMDTGLLEYASEDVDSVDTVEIVGSNACCFLDQDRSCAFRLRIHAAHISSVDAFSIFRKISRLSANISDESGDLFLLVKVRVVIIDILSLES